MDTLVTDDLDLKHDADELTSIVGTRGLDLLESEPGPADFALKEKPASGESVDLTDPEASDTASDPVRVYLREMGASPLLTREGEVQIAKRIERGQLSALKALSRSPLVIHQVLAIGDDFKRGLRSIKETVVFDEEEITEEILQDRA